MRAWAELSIASLASDDSIDVSVRSRSGASEERTAVKTELAGAEQRAVGEQGEVGVEGQLEHVQQWDVVCGLVVQVHPALHHYLQPVNRYAGTTKSEPKRVAQFLE